LIIYLDSQDFSKFSPSHSDYEKLLPVKNELMKLKMEGVAIFPFSDIHVFENLPKSPEDGPFGLERIRTIVEICGEEHLPLFCPSHGVRASANRLEGQKV